MAELGLLHVKRGRSFYRGGYADEGAWHGLQTRFWPSPDLLALATAQGLTADRVKAAFKAVVSSKPPKVVDPIRLRGPSIRKGNKKRRGKLLPINAADPVAQALLQTVLDYNAFAATFDVTGCTPPRCIRSFNLDFGLGGRWYAMGHDEATTYLRKPEEDRLRDVQINGEPVVEVDAKASHLTIVHGLLGLPLPNDDLYTVGEDLPRSAVKAWTTQSLGKGKPAGQWSRQTAPDQRTVSAKVVQKAMLARYPFLANLRQIVPAPLQAQYGERPEIVALHLQAVEAAALTHAISYVRNHGHLALPTHDGLIVIRSAEEIAKRGLEDGYQRWAKITPRLDVERAKP